VDDALDRGVVRRPHTLEKWKWNLKNACLRDNIIRDSRVCILDETCIGNEKLYQNNRKECRPLLKENLMMKTANTN
jgi:hypothetical protein